MGWLWNLRLEQGSRAILPNATRLTHRVSESTNEASQQRPGTRPNLPPRVAGRHPRRLGNPPTGFLSCKPQTTALPRSPDVYRDPRLSPDVYQESLLFRDPSAGTGQPTQTQSLGETPHPDSDKPGAYLNSPLSCGPIPGLYLLKPGSLPTGSPTCQPRQARHKPIPSTHLDLPPLF